MNHVSEWRYFDMLPRPIRHALIEADFDYSSEQVFQAYQETCAAFVFGDPIQNIIGAIRANEQQDAARHRQEMRTLTIRLRS